MNLHGIVSGAVGAVNPQTKAMLSVSAGYVTADDGTQVPAYLRPKAVLLQIQALTGADLKQLDSLNIQGSTQAVYVSGDVEGVVKPDNKGGDLLVFNHQIWLTTAVLERWPDWVKVAVIRQMKP